MSVANLTYDQDKQEYKIDLRMFLDDYMVIMGSLQEENNPYGQILSTPTKGEIRNYLDEHLKIFFNDQPIALKVNQVKKEDLAIHVILEIKTELAPVDLKVIKVIDTIYIERFNNQRNLIHINLPEKSKKSLLFNKYQRELTATWDT